MFKMTSPDRRASVRYPGAPGGALGVRTYCRQEWNATAFTDFSATGARLLLRDPPPPGELFLIELSGSRLGHPLIKWVEVVHATPRDNGEWLVGCRFAFRLSDHDVERALRGGVAG
jgi:hypothetical protein